MRTIRGYGDPVFIADEQATRVRSFTGTFEEMEAAVEKAHPGAVYGNSAGHGYFYLYSEDRQGCWVAAECWPHPHRRHETRRDLWCWRIAREPKATR